MEKRRKKHVEFRFYEKPTKEPVLALTGDRWIGCYGEANTLHFHNLMEIGRCIEGNGQMVINKNTFDYQPGTFTLIPHNVLHTTNSTQVCHWEYFFFDAEEIMKSHFKENPQKAERVLRSITDNPRVSHFGEDRHMGEIIQMVFELMKKKHGYYKETVRGLIFCLSMQLADKTAESAPSGSMKNAESEQPGFIKSKRAAPVLLAKDEVGSKIMPSLAYISGHYNEDLRIAELAECCHLSETHFRRIFHEEINMTPTEYLNLIRVQAACDLMQKCDCHMEEVAVKAGYQTMSTFNRNFQKIIGSSPYQWKRQVDTRQERIENYHISAKKGW